MKEMIINNIIHQQLYNYKLKQRNNTIELENEKYIISIIIYNCNAAEEMIYDKSKKDYFFYFHHDLFNDYQTIQFINDFLKIAFDLTECN